MKIIKNDWINPEIKDCQVRKKNNMVKVYPAIIHKEDGEYWVEFPDLDGCSTYGSTVEKVMQLASEALGLYLVSLLEDGADLPEASDIESLEGRTSYIAADINKYRRDIGL